jgi:hypothetical protein
MRIDPAYKTDLMYMMVKLEKERSKWYMEGGIDWETNYKLAKAVFMLAEIIEKAEEIPRPNPSEASRSWAARPMIKL